MKKIIPYFVILLFFLNFKLIAQHQDKNWYFGDGTDGIIFDVNNIPVKVTNKYPGVGFEGMVVVSDPYSGDLLFYTDGITVINKNHAVMSNGTGLLANFSGSQCVQACRIPDQCNQYYLISNSSWDNTQGSFYYSVVDFASNPLGQVTIKNQLIGGPNYHQAMRIVPKTNSNNYWLIGHLYNTAIYHVYEITPAGFIGPVIYNFSNAGRSWAMEYNENTHKLVNMGEDNLKVTLFDFDAASGVLSNEIQLAQPPITAVRVGNFSPDGSKIYGGVTPGNVLWQYDFSNGVWTNMNTCCYAHDVKTGPNGITYFINTYYATNPLSQMTDANLTAVGNACGYSTITNPGNFNGEVRRFPEFLVTVPPPVANLDTFTITGGGSITIQPLQNDSDIQGDPIALDSIIIQPQYGSIIVNGNQITYTAPPTCSDLIDSILYKIADDHCSYDTAWIIINVLGNSASASFTFSVDSCSGTVAFINSSINASNYIWNFGDGTSTSSMQNPVHTYLTAGTYNVTLIVSNSSACVDSILIPVTIPSVTVATASYNFNVASCTGTVTFTNQSLNATSYIWNFGDATPVDTTTNPSHTYLSSGTYTVTLIAFNSCSSDTIQQQVTINIQPAVSAAFIINTQPCNFTISITNQTINASSNSWNFGDGTSLDTNVNPSHTYTAPGVYTITLIATNSCNSDTLQQQLTITVPQQASAAFSFNTQPCSYTVSFINQSANATTYNWSFGDATPVDTNSNPLHTYSTNGTYTVTLISSNACGSDTIQQQVTIIVPSQVTSAFIINTQPCILTISLTNQSLNGTSYNWSFGDGNNSSLQNPTHTYSLPGIFTITLITSNSCFSDTLQQQIDLTNAVQPVANFVFTTQPCDLTVALSNQSQNTDSVLWDFGDGTSDTVFNPVHTYLSTGIYSVTLISFNQCGTDTIIQTVIDTFSQGVALFSFDQQPCETTIQFISQSQNAFSFSWIFGDGKNDTVKNPLHAYLVNGSYTVMLIVNAGTQCADTLEQTVIQNYSDTSLLFTPNVFTPNDDGRNEVFEIRGSTDCDMYHLKIFNRWGQLVYETDDINKYWDGKFKGKNVPDGIYYYLLNGSILSRHGSVTILR